MPYYDRNPSPLANKVAVGVVLVGAAAAYVYFINGGAKPPSPKDYVEGQIIVTLVSDLPDTMAPQGLGLQPSAVKNKYRIGSHYVVLLTVPVGREQYYVDQALKYPSIYTDAGLDHVASLH